MNRSATRTRRQLAAIVVVSGLGLAACSSDEPAAETTTTTTTVADSTTTTVAGANPVLEVALGLAGDFTGEWTNTTFGSTGGISFNLAVDEVTEEITIVMDVDGQAFGNGDPDPVTFNGKIEGLALAFNEVGTELGDVVGTMGADGINVTITNVPGGRIESTVFTGQVDLATGEINGGAYIVTFTDGTTAEGTFQTSKV